ncbi:hypothetical protein [Zavarzinella formosa]|uniref:hypothetical protein n=1 Tax=Zavarzinella formosa TaxID=360055 RepID=UPI00036A4162|nr:hypothetical protein [Zavarzinella formosa]
MMNELWRLRSGLLRLNDHQLRTGEIISDRRFFLFVLTAGERLWTEEGSDILRPAIELAWKQAEHMVPGEEVAQQREDLQKIIDEAFATANRHLARLANVLALLFTEPDHAAKTMVFPHPYYDTRDKQPVRLLSQTELNACCRLMREIFGNPFRPIVIDPSWLTFDVRMIAAGAYEDRAFNRLPILADALQDAGCENEDILSHLRGDGPHVRGCWVLDLILGKS